MKQVHLLFFFVLLNLSLSAQIYFSKEYSNTTNNVVLTTVVTAPDGSIFAAGSMHNPTTAAKYPVLVKYDVDGDIVWQKAFEDIPNGFIQDMKINKDGACIMVLKTDFEFGTLKVSAAGNVLWSKMYTNPSDAMFASVPYTKYSLSITADNQLFVNVSQFTSSSMLYKISDDDGPDDGDGDGDDDEDNDGDNDDDGGDVDTVIIIDDSTSMGKIPTMCMTLCDDDTSVIVIGKDNDDCFAFRVGMSGNVLWSKVYQEMATGVYLRIKSIIPLSDGNYLMTGLHSLTYGSQYDEGIAVKLNKNGDIIWSKIYKLDDPNHKLDFEKVMQTADNRLFILGSMLDNSTYTYYPVFLEISSTGALLSSSAISDQSISTVTFPTAHIDAATDINNLIVLSNYSTTSLQVSYINKSSAKEHMACSPETVAMTVRDFAMASIPTRPLTNIHGGANTIIATAGTLNGTDMDLNLKTNCMEGSFKESTGIENNSSSTVLKSYPNPVTSALNLDADNLDGAMLKVYDITGKLLINEAIQNQSISVELLSAGLYNYTVTSKGQLLSGKFVK